jgi:hypothetical protein
MRENVSLRERILARLLQVLQSRRVVIALSALAVGVLVMAVPELAAIRGELLTLVISLALALIGGYSLSDAARIAREGNGASSDELRELVKRLLVELIEELGEEEPSAGDVREENVNV